jgi:hypothetical protein
VYADQASNSWASLPATLRGALGAGWQGWRLCRSQSKESFHICACLLVARLQFPHLLFGLRETGLQLIDPGLKRGWIDREQDRSSLYRLIQRYCDFLIRDIRRHFNDARGHNEGSQRCQIVEQRHENREYEGPNGRRDSSRYPSQFDDLQLCEDVLRVRLRVDHRHAVRHELLTVIHTWLAPARSS